MFFAIGFFVNPVNLFTWSITSPAVPSEGVKLIDCAHEPVREAMSMDYVYTIVTLHVILCNRQCQSSGCALLSAPGIARVAISPVRAADCCS